MKLLQIMAPGQAVWRSAPVPEPSAGEVLVKVAAVTTCPHWDLHLMSGEPMFPGRPLLYPYTPGQPGHEMTGTVVALGKGVTELAVGDRVAAWRDAGAARQGCYAQYVPFQVEHLLIIPADLESGEVASLELAMCVQVSFDQLEGLAAVRNQRFAVCGLGPAGLIAVQMAHAYGAGEVIALDPLPERRALALQLGADRAEPPSAPQFSDQESLFDTALDCTGLAGAVEFLMDRTQRVVALFGVLRDPVAFGFEHWRRGLHLLGYGRHNRAAAEKALALIQHREVQLAPLSTFTLPLTRYAEGIEHLRSKQAVKIRFLPWAEE